MLLTKRHGLYESSRIVYIRTLDISPNPAQPRKSFDPDSLKELAESISRYGVLQPLSVHRNRDGYSYTLVAGERRLRAAKQAGLDEVPCVVLDVDRRESAILALIENLHRRDLDFIEEAEGLNNLIQVWGMSQDEAARRVGRSQSAVANKLRILRLPVDMLCTIREAGLTERHARALLRLPDERRERALRHIIDEGLNVAGTERYIDELLAAGEKRAEKGGKNSGRRIYVLRDVRVFLNTINRGMDIMRKSGIPAECGRSETDTDIVLTIKLPKRPGPASRGD
ncbi:MAG: ParB/RepB/Spo0J family partition protein [Oscillospiraceae bacterium]|nr:ParB/RepB/Spo0J family partition protein [Oscillospiraceae bacterium]